MNARGFTLNELLIASGIGSVLILIVSGIAVIGFTQMNNLKDRIAAEENLNRIELLLRSTIGQAVDVSGTDMTTTSPVNVASWTGALAANFVANQISATPNWTMVGHFYRETGGSGLQSSTDGSQGTLQPTAIFYRRPSATTSGVLFFNMGATSSLTPNYVDPYVDRISYLEMQKNVNSTFNKVTSVRFRVSIRYHDFGIPTRTWCPVADIQGGICVTDAKYRDLDREFTILVRNNLLKSSGTSGLTGSTAEERVMGFLYFFKLINPLKE